MQGLHCSKSTFIRQRTFAALKYSQLNADALGGLEAATGQPDDFIISISEMFPAHVLRLLAETKDKLKAVGFKYIWTRNLTVLAKYTDDSVVQIVNSPAVVLRIAERTMLRQLHHLHNTDAMFEHRPTDYLKTLLALTSIVAV